MYRGPSKKNSPHPVNVRPSIRAPYRDTSQIMYLANPHFELVLDILAPRRQGQTVAALKAG
jgi:hypothetical protein